MAALEVALGATAVILDLAVPTFVILALMVVSLLIRRQGLSTLGFHRVPHGWVLTGKMAAFAAAWTLFDVGLLKPVENHLTSAQQDMSQFMSLHGNLGMLLTWLVLGWLVAGFGETLAFVGFVQTRITEVVGCTGARLAGAVVLSSVLFGLLHTEYGIVGVTVSAVNGVFYCVLRYRYGPCGRQSWRMGSSTRSASSASSYRADLRAVVSRHAARLERKRLYCRGSDSKRESGDQACKGRNRMRRYAASALEPPAVTYGRIPGSRDRGQAFQHWDPHTAITRNALAQGHSFPRRAAAWFSHAPTAEHDDGVLRRHITS